MPMPPLVLAKPDGWFVSGSIVKILNDYGQIGVLAEGVHDGSAGAHLDQELCPADEFTWPCDELDDSVSSYAARSTLMGNPLSRWARRLLSLIQVVRSRGRHAPIPRCTDAELAVMFRVPITRRPMWRGRTA